MTCISLLGREGAMGLRFDVYLEFYANVYVVHGHA